MSRGAGNVQRRILAFLDRDGAGSTFELAEIVYEVQPDKDGKIWLTDAQLSSIRRALNRPAKNGIVKESARTPAFGRGIWQLVRKRPCECSHHK
jgi:hypothetical protein